MDRKKFIKKLGGGAVAALMIGCCASCTKMENPIPPTNPIEPPTPLDIDFILDLTDPKYSSLQTLGEFVVVEGKHVVARTNTGEYIAATRLCSHEAYYKIEYWPNQNEWVCNEHGASFDLNGQGTSTFENPPTNVDPTFNDNGLTVYNTEILEDLKIRVFS